MARLVPWAVVAAVLSGVTANVLRLRADVSFAGPSVSAQVLELAAGAALIIAGGTAARGPARWLLPGAGAGWLIAEWASPAAPGAAAFTAGLVAALAALPLVLASRWRHGQERWGPAALLALAVLLALGAAVISGPLASAAASPRDGGCTDCAQDLIAVAHDIGLSTRLTQLGAQAAAAAGLLAAGWLAVTLARAWRRRPLGPSFDLAADAAAVVFTAVVCAAAVVQLRTGPAVLPLYLLRATGDGALLALSATLAVAARRSARARRLVAWAGGAVAVDPAGVAAAALAAALGDPGLRVAYPAPDGAWRDHAGQLVVLPETDVTMVTDEGEILAALIHSSPARIDHAAVTGAASAARLLLDTERIEAGARARVSDLSAARQRVAEAADAARARLERDLHDGAQQHLVALRYALGLAGLRAARGAEPALAARLADADRAAEQALADLRELAHGISAAALDVEGLAGAVRGAAEQAKGQVTIAELPTGQLPAPVERAAYRFIADFLRAAATAQAPEPAASIAVRRAGQDLIIELTCDRAPAGEWAAHLGDRIAAAGGQLTHTADNGRQRLIAVLPCG
jgi:signal transduction histidine kinase